MLATLSLATISQIGPAGASPLPAATGGPVAAAGADPAATPLVRAARLEPAVPAGSTALGPVAAAQPVPVDVVLAPSDPSGLAALVAAVQDPSSPSYHHWLTPAQFAARFAPSAAQVRSVTSWLAARGLAAHRSSEFTLSAAADAATVARGLGVPLERYRTRTGAQGFVAAQAPLVPAGLQSGIRSILGLDTLPAFSTDHTPARPRPAGRPAPGPAAILSPAGATPAATSAATSAATAPTACPAATDDANYYGGWTFSGLGQAYGIDSLLSAGLDGRGETIAFYELAPHSASDVSAYDTCFGLTDPLSTVTVDGGGSPTDANGTAEADLDIEQAATQAPGAALISYEGPNTGTGAYDVWSRIVGDDRAKVVSTSWDVCEPDAYSAGELSSYTTLFAQAVTQGQTILAASGDSGSEGCFQADVSTALAASYPSTDPDVTAVGGTDLTGTGPETVWNDCAGTGSSLCASNYGGQAAGGGGLSRYEPRLAGQPVVASWPTTVACGSSCREVPDISANAGIAMAEYSLGGWSAGLGTSFSAPFLAGLVADRNTGCAGGATGNLTTVLYGVRSAGQSAAAFSDVTSGNNDMTNSNAGAYGAGPGFDVASGLGSPLATGLTCPEVESVAPATAAAGTQVTVTGLGLEGATVTFGNLAATVVSSSATSATVVVPAGTGTAPVAAHGVLGAGTAAAAFTWAATSTTTSTTTVPVTTTTTVPVTTTTTTAPRTTTVACPAGAGAVLGSGAGIAAVDVNGCKGYLVTDRAGRVSAFGAATWHGDLSRYTLSAPVIAIEATPDGQGYWLLGADGGVFTFGDARFFGSTGGLRLAAPVVGMAVTPDSRGYWVVARDGGVFSFGDARFFGSTGGLRLASPVDGIAVAPGGSGYWLVAGDGGVFTFTRDGFYGSLGGVHLARPIVGMSSTPDGRGYTLVGSDGGVFTFGDAPFYGSLGSSPPASAIVDLSPAPADNGYYLVSAAGIVYNFGPGTRFFGSA